MLSKLSKDTIVKVDNINLYPIFLSSYDATLNNV